MEPDKIEIPRDHVIEVEGSRFEAAANGYGSWPRPIPVSERLPEQWMRVLGYSKDAKDWQLMCLDNNVAWCSGESDDWGRALKYSPIAWLPMPPKPE